MTVTMQVVSAMTFWFELINRRNRRSSGLRLGRKLLVFFRRTWVPQQARCLYIRHNSHQRLYR